MSWRTNSLALRMRNMGRRFGLNSFLVSFFSSNSYEDKFNKALLSHVKRNDVVWDVGANLGHYTKLFADLTGPQGEVFVGMEEILNSQELKTLGIEVHFGLLAARGMANGPQKIESLLGKAGFSCSWTDSSHILAIRTK